MTGPAVFDATAPSVCRILHIRAATVIGGGSGFFAARHLITNHHVFVGAFHADEVEIAFWDSTTRSMSSTRYPAAQFRSWLVTGSDENSMDYAILSAPYAGVQGLQLSDVEPQVGSPAFLLGYKFGEPRLNFNCASVSCIFSSGAADVIEFAGSNNPGMSGGPLVEANAGTVVGIVTRKVTGLTSQFDQLRAVIEQNVQALSAQTNVVGIVAGVNVREFARASQQQMLMFANEIYRSANVGIGMAFSVKHVLQDLRIRGLS